jgi:hypothetical protein
MISFSVHSSKHEVDNRLDILFENYEKIMNHHQIELVDEVFSQKFLKENGGKEEFISKVKELPPPKKQKKIRRFLQKWQSSKVGKVIFAKVKDDSSEEKNKQSSESQFVIVEEDGKLKIDGTMSDGQ